jgi:RNA recognition motif-containing protein
MGMSTLSMQDSLDEKKLFVGGIPWAFDSEDLREVCSPRYTIIADFFLFWE